MPDIYSSPQKKNDLQTFRGSALGQMHQGDIKTFVHHPVLRFFLRLGIFLNVASWIGLWTAFRFKNFFPPHDAPFMSAIGWFFFFGAALCFFAVMVFSYAKKIETEAITRALTNNRSYAWHSQHGTLSTHETDPTKPKPPVEASIKGKQRPAAPPSQAVGAGARQYRAATWLILISLVMWTLGAYSVMENLF